MAHIEVHRHELPLDRFYFTYSWVGKKSEKVFLDEFYAHTYGKLPWNLIQIGEYDYLRRGYWFVRKDAALWFLEPIRMFIHKSWRWFGNRLLLTLGIWGVKKYQPGRRV
jgi:hypothetical protein